mmetsp:Transcript_33494/g.52042  ORF Transcript_33494/g.52042 Transcript_33494/m.52042 type:complete len:132 (-) Transcript_33494:170-565(-)
MFNRDMNGIDLSDQMRLSRSNTETIGREKKPYMKFFWGLIDLVISQGCLFCREFAPKNYADYEYRGCLQTEIDHPSISDHIFATSKFTESECAYCKYLSPSKRAKRTIEYLARKRMKLSVRRKGVKAKEIE